MRCVDVTLFLFNGLLASIYLRMFWTDLYQIFRIGTFMSGHDQSDLLFAMAQGKLLW